jgi:D-glycero-D-manno-heptose 1,7-bisphosphate phosphatase
VILEEAFKAIAQVQRAGLRAIVVTNQPEIASGELSRETLDRIHQRLRYSLAVDDIYVCPHGESDGCDCRKPRPGMLNKAAHQWDIDLTHSFMIGDRWRDVSVGKAAGCYTVLIRRPYSGEVECDYEADGVLEAVNHILRLVSSQHHGASVRRATEPGSGSEPPPKFGPLNP